MARERDVRRVVVVHTQYGEQPYILRGDPSDADVKGFIKEKNRRYEAHEPGGPNPDLPSFKCIGATRFASEEEIDGPNGKPIKVGDL